MMFCSAEPKEYITEKIVRLGNYLSECSLNDTQANIEVAIPSYSPGELKINYNHMKFNKDQRWIKSKER